MISLRCLPLIVSATIVSRTTPNVRCGTRAGTHASDGASTIRPYQTRDASGIVGFITSAWGTARSGSPDLSFVLIVWCTPSPSMMTSWSAVKRTLVTVPSRRSMKKSALSDELSPPTTIAGVNMMNRP